MAPAPQEAVLHPNVSKMKSKQKVNVARTVKPPIVQLTTPAGHAKPVPAFPVRACPLGSIRSGLVARSVKKPIAVFIMPMAPVEALDVPPIHVLPYGWIMRGDVVCRIKHLIVPPIIPTAHAG